MKLYKLDTIVRSSLLRKGYPIHWYLEFLKYATDCLRELHFDTMKSVNTVKLTIGSYGAVPLPCDYVDTVRIGSVTYDKLAPFAASDNINRLNNFDSAGAKIPYPSDTNDDGTGEITIRQLGWGWAEGVGWYGLGGGTNLNSFKLLRERSEIQFSGVTIGGEIILEYISDGLSADAATKVHPYAQATIEAYINWQHKQNNRTYNNQDREIAKGEYYNQYRVLRGRLNSMTLADLRRIINLSYSGTVRM